MQLVKDVIKEQYGGSTRLCTRLTGQHTAQLYRWMEYGCMVDSKGVVWKPQGKLANKDQS